MTTHTLRKFADDSGKKLVDLSISSNVTLGVAAPADPGVAVWFTWDGLVSEPREPSPKLNPAAAWPFPDRSRV